MDQGILKPWVAWDLMSPVKTQEAEGGFSGRNLAFPGRRP